MEKAAAWRESYSTHLGLGSGNKAWKCGGQCERLRYIVGEKKSGKVFSEEAG